MIHVHQLKRVEHREQEVKQRMAKVEDSIVEGDISHHWGITEDGIRRKGSRHCFGGPIHRTRAHGEMPCCTQADSHFQKAHEVPVPGEIGNDQAGYRSEDNEEVHTKCQRCLLGTMHPY